MINNSQMSALARKALWISIGIAVAVTITTIFSLNIVFNNFKTGNVMAWQRLAIRIIAIASVWSNVYLCRNGRYILGIQILIGGLLITSLLVTFMLEGHSTIISLAIMTLIIIATTQTLLNSIATRLITLSVVVGILNVLLDIWLPTERIAPPDFNSLIIPGIVAALFLAAFVISQYKTFKLQTKLLIVLISIPAIIIAIVSAFFVLNITNSEKEQIIQSNLVNTNAKASRIDAFLNTAGSDIHFLGNSALLNEYLTHLDANTDANITAEARTLLNQEFLAFAQARLTYDQVRFIDTTGQEIIRINTSIDGVSTIVAEENLQNKSGRYYFEDSLLLSKGNLFISPLDLNVENGEVEKPNKPVIRYGTPVFFHDELAGVIIANVLADNFLSILADSEINSFLVNKDGYFLYHPDESLQWGQDLGTEINVAQEIPDLAPQLFSIGSDSYESSTQLYTYTPIILPDETIPRWFLANFISIDEVFAPITNTITPILAIIAISLMITPLLAIFVSKFLAEPILSLTHSAQKVAEGDLNVEAPVTTQDEIGILATTFNAMITQLKNLVGALETRVAEQTQDLTLAAEVGNAVAQIRDLDELLVNAVEMIGARFNLYYTQVYLVDESSQKLQLRAGTGEVGKTLMSRRFSLPLGPGSINSTAVFNKKPIIVANTNNSVVFRPNPLLPNTRSEMAVPLMIGDVVVGVLDLQSAEINDLSDENLPAFEALAGQLAISIENANLFAEVTRARAEVEAQARRLVRDGWDNSLDGVHASEHIGTYYEEGQAHPLTEPMNSITKSGHALSAPITVVGEPIGAIQVEGVSDQAWTDDDHKLITLVAQRVGQQVENLRLLSDAQRYRTDAENAARKLVRDGWSDFQEQSNVDGYVYNQKDVISLQEINNTMDENEFLMQPLTIQGEIIGMIEVDGVDAANEEANTLLTAVTDQLSSHINNLRLADQTEQALGKTAVQARRLAQLNEMGNALGVADTLAQLFTAVSQNMGNIINHDSLALTLRDPDEQTSKTFLLENERDPILIEAELLGAGTAVDAATKQQRPIHIPNLKQTDFEEIRYMVEDGLQSALMTPLITARGVLGALTISRKTISAFDAQDEDILQQIVPLLASTIENQSLLTETQKQADKERLVNIITQKIQRAVTVESALETAVQELGRTLGAEETRIRLQTATSANNGNDHDV